MIKIIHKLFFTLISTIWIVIIYGIDQKWNFLNQSIFLTDVYNVPLVKTQMKKIIVTAKTLYSHPKNVSKIYAALHTDLAW